MEKNLVGIEHIFGVRFYNRVFKFVEFVTGAYNRTSALRYADFARKFRPIRDRYSSTYIRTYVDAYIRTFVRTYVRTRLDRPFACFAPAIDLLSLGDHYMPLKFIASNRILFARNLLTNVVNEIVPFTTINKQ